MSVSTLAPAALYPPEEQEMAPFRLHKQRKNRC